MRPCRALAGVVCCLAISGCDQARAFLGGDAPVVPEAEAVALYFAGHANLIGVEVSGNVVEVRVRQPLHQIERGGPVWARVGPYIYLFTPSTRQVFEDFPGVAAVRVITLLPNDDEVARAMLRRDRLTDVRWRRSLNLLGTALQHGQESPRRLEELTEWGEQHADFRYNPDYVGRP